MKKILVAILLSALAFGVTYSEPKQSRIVKVRTHYIKEKIHPISVYEVCIDGIMYLIITKGYRAGMSPKYVRNDKTEHIEHCYFEGEAWKRQPLEKE